MMKIATFVPDSQISHRTLLVNLNTNQIENYLFSQGLSHDVVWMALDILDSASLNATLAHLIDAAQQAVKAEENGSY